jgi:hypothetical protein
VFCPQATYYKDCDRTLLVFVWSHVICDVTGGLTFLNRWLRGTATATATAVARWEDATIVIEDTGNHAQESGMKVTDTDVDRGLWRFERLKCYGKPSAAVLARLLEPVKGFGPAPAPTWPPNLTVCGAGEGLGGDVDSSSSSGGSSTGDEFNRMTISGSVQQTCRKWLATQECPFPVCGISAQRLALYPTTPSPKSESA